MKFLADENLERSIIEKLKEDGHDIARLPIGPVRPIPRFCLAL
jgi:hypothetical protein